MDFAIPHSSQVNSDGNFGSQSFAAVEDLFRLHLGKHPMTPKLEVVKNTLEVFVLMAFTWSYTSTNKTLGKSLSPG